ncbi:MAG: hypothetical protein ACI3XA_09215 [Clostridia bacterium]
MKRFILFIIIALIITASIPVGASNSFMALTPYPYSTHVLGEDLIIYGNTDFGSVVLSLFYPEDGGYMGMAVYTLTLTASELRQGHVIKTEPKSLRWPEGKWKVRIQNGTIYDELYINMTEFPVFDQSVRVCEYENSTLTSLATYNTRGVQFKDNIISFVLEDGTEVKIYYWDNFKPVDTGTGRIYIAFYHDGYLTDIKTYPGELSTYGYHVSLNISDNRAVKIFYWNENLNPKY